METTVFIFERLHGFWELHLLGSFSGYLIPLEAYIFNFVIFNRMQCGVLIISCAPARGGYIADVVWNNFPRVTRAFYYHCLMERFFIYSSPSVGVSHTFMALYRAL